MKFLLPNYSCLYSPWLGGYRPQIPVLCPQLNLLNPPTLEQNSWVRHWPKTCVWVTNAARAMLNVPREVSRRQQHNRFCCLARSTLQSSFMLMHVFGAWKALSLSLQSSFTGNSTVLKPSEPWQFVLIDAVSPMVQCLILSKKKKQTHTRGEWLANSGTEKVSHHFQLWLRTVQMFNKLPNWSVL